MPRLRPARCVSRWARRQSLSVMFGLWRFYVVRSQFHTARELGETLLRLAQRADAPALAVIAHYALGLTWFCLGALPAARQHLEEGSAHYMLDQRRSLVFRMSHDPVSPADLCRRTLWLLGYPDEPWPASTMPWRWHTSCHIPLVWRMRGVGRPIVSQFRRDVPAVHEQAEAAVVLSTEQGFPHWVAGGTILRGWALAMQGQGEEGMAQVRQGIAAWRATGAALCPILVHDAGGRR